MRERRFKDGRQVTRLVLKRLWCYSWFCDRALVSCECAASSVLEPCALSSVCLVSCWSVVFGSRHSCLEFRFRVGVRTLELHVLSHCVSSSLGRARFCPRVFCVVAGSSCFYRLCAFMLSCLVWTCGLWVFSLAACSCPVLHMAGDLFCWPCACVFVLCEHMAFVLVFCVPCALMSWPHPSCYLIIG